MADDSAPEQNGQESWYNYLTSYVSWVWDWGCQPPPQQESANLIQQNLPPPSADAKENQLPSITAGRPRRFVRRPTNPRKLLERPSETKEEAKEQLQEQDDSKEEEEKPSTPPPEPKKTVRQLSQQLGPQIGMFDPTAVKLRKVGGK